MIDPVILSQILRQPRQRLYHEDNGKDFLQPLVDQIGQIATGAMRIFSSKFDILPPRPRCGRNCTGAHARSFHALWGDRRGWGTLT
jgi:hypothetical protein